MSKFDLMCALFHINTNICLNFENEWSTFDMQTWHLKLKSNVHSRVLNPFHKPKDFRFAWNFIHLTYESNGTYCKKYISNPNYYVPMVIGQSCKNVILRNVHPLGWLLWMWFYPRIFSLTPLTCIKKCMISFTFHITFFFENFVCSNSTFVYPCVHEFVYLLVYTWICVYVHVCLNLYLCLWNNVFVYVYMSTYLYDYECAYLCLYGD
jgi:hypothetical protein